jgi:hypothetical protein
MSKLEKILDYLPDETFVTIDGFYDAIIGVNTDSDPMTLVYSVPEMIECLMKQDMTLDEAIDFFEYKTRRSIPYVENAPVLVDMFE